MANGRLGPRGTGSHRPVVDAVAERHGIGPDAVALGAVLAQPWADVVLSGAVSEAQLRSNLEAIDAELSDADLAELAAITEAPDLYWERRSRLPWS
jgi:aryl-alcohol dehydrogenase-like predicted oxidoreductase